MKETYLKHIVKYLNEIKTDDGSKVISSTVSPKVRVTIPEDKTTAPTVIPQTGDTPNPIIITSAILLVLCIVISIRFYLRSKDIK